MSTLSLPGRPSSGASSQGSATRVSRVRSVRAWGRSTGPTACALAGRRCSLWGWGKGVPGGGAFHRCEGRLRSGAVLPPTARQLGGLLGSATHVLWARVCGCGGPTLSPWPACPVGAACRGGGGGPSPGGVACHRCEGRLVSGAVPPPAARPLERAARVPRPGVPGAVGAGVGTQHRPHSVRPCGPALLAVGVAEGRPRGGAFHHCAGCLRSGAVPPPTTRPLGGPLGSATHVPDSRMYLLGICTDSLCDWVNRVHNKLNHVLTQGSKLDESSDWDQQASWTNRGIVLWVRDETYGSDACELKEEEVVQKAQAAEAQAPAASKKKSIFLPKG